MNPHIVKGADRALASRPGFPLARAAGTYALARGIPVARSARSAALRPARARRRLLVNGGFA